MALIILEGLDRTGKTSVAQHYQDQGYEVVHMSAPDKALSQPGYTGPSYLDQMVELLMGFAGRDVILDRSHYGELVWPQIYGRKPLLNDEDLEILREIEETLDVTRVLMHDPNTEAHWQRCVANNEPMTKAQFIKARTLFSNLADKYDFSRKTLNDFPEAASLSAQVAAKPVAGTSSEAVSKHEQLPLSAAEAANRTPQQVKLDKANAINEILAKRIVRQKGNAYDELERNIRGFLNNELGKIFGTGSAPGFSNEEVELLKFFCERLKSKESQ